MPGLTVACQIADSVWQVLDLDTFVPQPQYAFAQTHPADAFVTTWSTTATNQTVTIPVGNSMAAYDIDWGDGATETDAIGDRVHTYLNADTYTVSISGGFDRIHLHGYGDEAAENAGRLASIEQWGDASWSTMQNAFSGTSNMVYRATDAPNLSRVTDMSGMFRDAAAFNGNISSWDVSSVERMEFMFTGATDFDQPLNNWDVSSATNMDAMFSGAAAFDQPLNDWNVSSATSMDAMFSGAAAFNGNISSWDVSSATDMNFMFRNAHSFDQPLSSWDVSSVIAMIGMFWGAHSFDQPLSSWDVSSVIAMYFMFADAAAFNGNISSWDVSSATDMGKMFEGATAFDQDLASWYIILNDTILTSDPASTLTILPLSPYLDPIWQTYSVNDTRFAIDHRTLSLNPEDPPPAGEHPLAVTAPALLSEPNTASHTRIVTIIVLTGPVPNLTTDSPPVTNAASVTVTVDFGKPIDPGTFTLGDVSVSGGTASNLAHSSANQNFTFTLTPGADGLVTAAIPVDSVTDPASNSNTASNVLRVTFDSARPGPALSTDAASPTNAASATVTVDFGEPIDPATFAISDVSVSGGDASDLAQNGATTQQYTFTVTPASDGTITVTIPADSVTDPAGNSNTASNVLRVTFDSAPPGPALSTDAASPTNATSVTVTVDFGKPIDPATFTLGDVSVSGGTASNLAHSSANQNFTFTLTPSADGEVTAVIPADSVMDIADNSNTVSNVLRVTFDSAQPGPTLSTDAASPTNAASVTVTVDFGEPIDPDTFTLGDVSVFDGTTSNLVHSSANQTFTFTLTPGADGEVTATIEADRVTDPAGNSNTASNVLRVTFDRTAPVITVQGASPASIYAGQAYEDLGAACHDNLDGDLTDNVTATSNVDASAVGHVLGSVHLHRRDGQHRTRDPDRQC